MHDGGESALSLRRMRPEETAEACALWTRSKKRAYPWLTIEQAHTAEEDFAYFSGTLLGRSELWVALHASRIVGLMALEASHIGQLYVEPSEQGRSVGSALLAHAKQLCPGGLSLFTFQRNARARAFYEARGFRAVFLGVSPPPENEPDVRYEWP